MIDFKSGAYMLVAFALLCSCHTDDVAVVEEKDCSWVREREVGADELWNGITASDVVAQVDGRVGDWSLGSVDGSTRSMAFISQLEIDVEALGTAAEYRRYEDGTDELCIEYVDDPVLGIPSYVQLSSEDGAWAFAGELTLLYQPSTRQVQVDRLADVDPIPSLAVTATDETAPGAPFIEPACSGDLRVETRAITDPLVFTGHLLEVCEDGSVEERAWSVWE